MIIFVGDKPSSKNIDPDIPFVGTQSYKKLLEWIGEMDINIMDVKLTNQDQIKIVERNSETIHPKIYDRFMENAETDKFIALGNIASGKLNKVGIEHFKLPHPSGLNRKINDKKYIKDQLKLCKEYINENL